MVLVYIIINLYMFFPEDQIQYKASEPQTTIIIYDNAALEIKPTQIKIRKKKTKFKDIAKALNYNHLRLFNSEGAQYFEDDLQYIKNKTILYASHGEDFDPASCFGQYQMIEKLGQGGFGKVFLARSKQTKEKYAIKIIKTQNIDSAADIDNIFLQVEVLKTLKHENIVTVHNCYTLKNMQVAIIMEFLEGGQLLKYVQKEKRLDEQTAKIFVRQIVKGMLYCHQRNLIHRDLKLENLLLVNKEEKKIKIIDFGIAGVMNFLTWQDMDTGSLAYMAPQCFINSKNYKVDGRIDVWATGIILYCMLTGQLPFKGNNTLETVQAIKLGKYKLPSVIQKTLSEECLDVLKQCLNINSKNRISMQQLLDHPWLTTDAFNKFQKKKALTMLPSVQEKPHEQNNDKKPVKPIVKMKNPIKPSIHHKS